MKQESVPSLSHQAGFTLLELLVSFTLAAIITAFITGGLHFGMRAWESSDRSEAMQEVVLVDHTVANWLAGAMAVSKSESGNSSELEFEGNPNSLTFVTLSDGRTQRAGLVEIKIGQAPRDPSGSDAVAESKVFRRGPDLQNASTTMLAKDALMTFAYFGATNNISPPSWRTEWKHMSALPLLVSFRIKTRLNASDTPTLVRLQTGDVLSRGVRG